MREGMEKLLQEETGVLQISCDFIEQELESGQASGSFSVKSMNGKAIKGKVIVSDPRVKYQESGFQSEQIQISYYFDGSDTEPTEIVSGSFMLITNFGEFEIPFSFYHPKQDITSSLGEIKNLFHFTNLAKTNWQEALKLYFSPAFKEVLKKTGDRTKEIYRGLSGKVNEQYMDEFLQAIHKKGPVEYEILTNMTTIENVNETRCIPLEIRKKGWGYTCLKVKTDGDFLAVEKEKILEEDFIANIYQLPVYVDVTKLHQGKNRGQIILKSPYGEETVPVLVSQNQHHKMRSAIEKRKNTKWLNTKLTQAYINFRSKKMAALRFKKESEEILDALQKSDERNPVNKLYGAHLYITQEKYHEAKWYLDRAEKNIGADSDPAIYAYYLYLTTLITEDKEYVLRVKEKIEELYYTHDGVWQIAWLWMYLSKELLGNAQKKWDFLMNLFVKGCTSPVMYMEAVMLLNYQPTLLMELSEANLRILRFAQKRGMLSEQVIGIIQYLALKEKEFTIPVYKLLTAIAKEHENQELLQAICSLLIKGNKIGQKYFGWYEKAILAEIKITRLYEYYMMSLDQEKPMDIPKMVLMYFSYQTDMNADYAPYLYRYVYENREHMEDLYFAYAPGMERFLTKKLYGEKINEDLGYLYEQIILPRMMTEDNAKALTKVMFTHLLKGEMESGDSMVVIHGQMKEEAVYPCKQGKAEVLLYNDNYCIFRQDKEGNRFLKKEEVFPQSYMNPERTAQYIRAWVQNDLGLALYLCNNGGDWQNITWEKELHFKYLSECDKIKGENRTEIRSRLLEFYYDADAMEKLDQCLEECIPGSVDGERRRELIHYLVIRGYYEKAYDFIRIYGPENAEPKDLVRITSYMLEEGGYEKEILLWYIYTAFVHGKYNVNMLQYLCNNYQGSSKIMRNIFKAAHNFDLDTFELSERLLMQILSTKAYIGDETEIFKAYVAGGPNTNVEAAFLTYRAVEYMRDDRIIGPYLILDIGRVYRRGYKLPLVTHLAYLRYFAENREERGSADENILQEFLQEIVVEKEILVPFIQEYADMPGMESLADKTLVSYKTEPKSRVIIHYLKNHEEDERPSYIREEMKEVYFGVYVKEFILFYGESLQYYITEEQENLEQLTESGILQKEESKEDERMSRYQMINEMSIGENLQDYNTVYQLLEDYWRTEFVADHVFHL